MRNTIKATVLSLTVVGALGLAASANAAPIHAGAHVGGAVKAAVAQQRGETIHQVGHRHRGGHRRGGHWRGRRHRHHHGYGAAFALPFLALGLAAQHHNTYYSPAPAWRFNGYQWVCDYVDYYGRPLCR